MSNESVVNRFIAQAGLPSPRYLADTENIKTGREMGGLPAIYSYGTHFPMAILMPDEETGDARGWWLVNGDKYSLSTARHQSLVRRAISSSGLPSVIISFSAMRQAGIDRSTVKVVHRTADQYSWEYRTWDGTNGDGDRREGPVARRDAGPGRA